MLTGRKHNFKTAKSQVMGYLINPNTLSPRVNLYFIPKNPLKS